MTPQHIYICCGVNIWAKFGLFNSYYLGQVFFLKCCVKNTIKYGFQQIKKVLAQFLIIINWAKLAFFYTNLAQLVTIALAQLVMFKNGHFFAICCF